MAQAVWRQPLCDGIVCAGRDSPPNTPGALGARGALRTVGGQVEAGQVGELEAQVLAQRRQVQVVQRLLLDLPAAQAGWVQRSRANVRMESACLVRMPTEVKTHDPEDAAALAHTQHF